MTGATGQAPAPSAATLRALARVSTATITSQLLRRGFRNTFIGGLTPLRPDLRMAGPAFTLRYAPSREDLDFSVDFDNARNVQRVAVETIPEGAVLVIDARGVTAAASFGHIIATRIKMRGAAGLVTDGALRDTPRFTELELPTYCRAAHATTSSVAHHPVDLNVPIGCGEVLVVPGDVVVGDAEGVAVIPRHLAEETAEGALEQELVEDYALERVDAGDSLPGLYPLGDEHRDSYERWRSTRPER